MRADHLAHRVTAHRGYRDDLVEKCRGRQGEVSRRAADHGGDITVEKPVREEGRKRRPKMSVHLEEDISRDDRLHWRMKSLCG
ncbi:hypothetical protein GCM10011576_31580 [Micromonospora parathelypteridis]|nr:hypothetical protein GCM10011576_31580 [Micromonospora parathelypteridis]